MYFSMKIKGNETKGTAKFWLQEQWWGHKCHVRWEISVNKHNYFKQKLQESTMRQSWQYKLNFTFHLELHSLSLLLLRYRTGMDTGVHVLVA
jgi:hypothetical protein